MRINTNKVYSFTFIFLLFGLLAGLGLFTPRPVNAHEVFDIRLASKPFSPTMCKKLKSESYIRLLVAHHRDIILRKVPGQHIPKESDEARKKDYVHFVNLMDMTNGLIHQGSIAFDQRHAVIFQDADAKGLSAEKFLAQFGKNQQPIVQIALNTFLRLHSLFNAAVDTCRPYPSRVTYGTDDEIDRIEAGKYSFNKLVKQFNNHPIPSKPLYYHESGKSQGFVDPEAGKNSNISYQAMNPLNFFVPDDYLY